MACAAAAGGLSVSACTETTTGIDEQTYVEVMSRLTWSRARFLDSPQDDSIRAEVLAEHGITGQDLLDFADRYGEDVTRMDRLWESIRLRVAELDQEPDPNANDGTLEPTSPGGGTTP